MAGSSTARAEQSDAERRAAPPDQGVVARAKDAFARVKATRPARAVARYVVARGRLFAGGITYSALFSIFAALAIAYTAFMAVLGNNDELRQTVLSAVDNMLPGIIDDGSGSGLLDPDDLVLETALTPGGVAAVAVLIWAAVSVMRALRSSIQAMFGIVALPENILVSKLRELAGFVALAVGVLLTAALGLVAGTLGEQVLNLLDIEGGLSRWLLRTLGFVVALAVDWAVFIMLLRVTAGVRPLRRDLFLGALLGALAAGILRQIGTSVVGGLDNPLLASFAAVATLLLWVNLMARIALLVSAWTANPPEPERPERAEEVHRGARPNFVTESAPATKEWAHQPLTGTLLPDETLHPDYVPPGELPRWGGPIGAFYRWRIRRLERKAARARERYEAAARRV